MINHITGNISYKSPTYIVVETNGVGYHINISLNTYTQIEKLENVKILTILQIREDAHILFGFADEVERNLFKHLISVSGVGPSIAQLVLSGMQPDEVRAAIIGDNDLAFSKVKGIGPKTAKRIILDLKDKLVKDGGEELPVLTPTNNTMREEALSALLALGFQKIPAQKALNKLLKERTDLKTVEALIKAALKEMSL